MTPWDQERLMEYVDGELSPSEAHAVEQWLARDLQAREYVATLRELDDAIEALMQRHLEAAPDLGPSILARIARERLSLGPVPLAASPANDVQPAIAIASARPAPRGWPAAVVAAFAAAAAAFILGGAPASGPGAGQAVAPAPLIEAAPRIPTPPAAQPELAEPEEAQASASIEAVDFGDRGGTIFVLEGSESTPVVWLDDDAPPRARVHEL